MPNIFYDDIYKRALSRITDLELAVYTKNDFYEYMKEWLHSTASSPFFRKKFSKFSLDDKIMQIEFELNTSVDDEYDINFVTSILSKGLIINYLPSKLEHSKNMATAIGGKEEKVLLNNYNKNIERLAQLKHEYD